MREPVRIAVLVSGGGTNLQALIDAGRAGILHSGRIVLVISNKEGVYALDRAQAASIPAATVPRKSFESQAAFEGAISGLLREYRVELIVLAGFLSILSADFTKRWEKRILNVHPSLIPSFCGKDFYGLKVHEAALERGVKVTGATVHFVNEIPDGGEIILQKAVAIREKDTPQSLQQRVMRQAEWKILPKATEQVAAEIIRQENREQKQKEK